MPILFKFDAEEHYSASVFGLLKHTATCTLISRHTKCAGDFQLDWGSHLCPNPGVNFTSLPSKIQWEKQKNHKHNALCRGFCINFARCSHCSAS